MAVSSCSQSIPSSAAACGLSVSSAATSTSRRSAGCSGARLSAPHGAVCAAVLAASMAINLRALRDRAPEHPALRRLVEVAALLTDRPQAAAEDGIDWLQELTATLSIPGLLHYGLDRAEIPDLVSGAQQASSMRANPIELSDAEVREILTRSL